MQTLEYRSLVTKAHWVLDNGRKSGRIAPEPCAICHKTIVEGHHTDYRKPYQIVWLCKTHHRNAHKGVLQFLGPDTIYRIGRAEPRAIGVEISSTICCGA